MTFLVWRQYRLQWAIALALLAAITAVELYDGLHMAAQWHMLQAFCPGAAPSAGPGGGCLRASIVSVAGNDVRILSVLVPAVLGILWGAPLIAHELEGGTATFAWTQGITRTRWLVTKVAIALLAAAIWAGAVSALVTWWSGPQNAQQADAFQPNYFETQGIVPIGYAVFAMALGITAGVLLRRTLPAIAVTLAGFIGMRLWFGDSFRYHLLPTVTTSTSLGSAWSPGGISVVQGAGVLNAAGQQLTGGQYAPWLNLASGNGLPATAVPAACHQYVPSAVPDGANASPALVSCLSRAGFRNYFSYLPGNRYWPLQGLETGIYVLLAAILLAVALVVIRRRDA